MTKKLKLFAFALIIVLTCAGFVSCSNDVDDPPSPSQLIGSVWKGINYNSYCPVEVKIESAEISVITVYIPNSAIIYDQVRRPYFYIESTGEFFCEYDNWNIKGYIEGSQMNVTDNRYGKLTLKRVK